MSNQLIIIIFKRFFILIGLPDWEKRNNFPIKNISNCHELKIKIPTELMEKIQLATHAKVENSFDETVIRLLKKGLSVISSDIRRGVISQLDTLDEL